MLDLDSTRDGPPPRDAATIIVLRDGKDGVETFCVERNKKSRFLGGAIVFPGGRVEDADRDAAWSALVNAPVADAFGIAACRETLEEAALLIVDREVPDDEVRALHEKQNADATALRTFLSERGARLDLAALHVLARWITPKVEARRYDTRFFLAAAPRGQTGTHDMSETMASFWATPREILARFDRSEIQLAPPTHRTLSCLAPCATARDAFAFAASASLDPICPELVQFDGTMALVLPGDREHSICEVRVAGPSRYVLRGEHWRAE
jgi:8-oxo-dGTP pyrophosphatase MutT (NUDIX family)